MSDEQAATIEPEDNAPAIAPEANDNLSDWKSGLSEELRADPTLANIKDAESAANTLIHQQKMIGSRVPLPKTDEERSELYSKLGRPDDPSGYELKVPEGYGQYYPEETMNSFREAGHKLGLSPDQMAGLMEWQKGAIDYQIEDERSQVNATAGESEEMLRKEFGNNYDKNLRAANRALSVFGDDDIRQKLQDPRYGNDPSLIRLLVKAGEGITEDSAKGTANNSLVMSPLDAQQRIDQINSDKGHAYWDAKNPKHSQAQKEMQDLFDKAFNK
jgi:hypothetical protein